MLIPTTKQAYKFFHEGALTLARIEHTGIKVNEKYLDKAITKTKALIQEKTEGLKCTDIYKLWRRRFTNPNLSSRQQLGVILYDELKHKVTFRSAKSGKAKVDQRALELIKIPFVTDYLEVEKLHKVYNTYLRGIKREICEGRVHPSYNLAGGLEDEQKGGAASYRSSCSDPNFTNMPIRNKTMGKIIRSCFEADEGYCLGEIDFSKHEVGIAAAVTGDPVLIDYVKHSPPKCMHTDGAKLLFFLKTEQVGKKTTRDVSKNKFIFPQFFGADYLTCTEDIWEMLERNNFTVEGSNTTVLDHLKKHGIHSRGKCDRESEPRRGTFEYRVKEVQNILWNKWFTHYTKWKKKIYNEYLQTGEVQLPTGFVARGVFRRNQVLNLPIQGPAFHCLLWSMIEISKRFRHYGMKSRIVGQIHDCVLPEIWIPETQAVLDICHDVMTKALPKAWKWITVPLKIEVDLSPEGKTWHDKEPWIYKNDKWVAA